MFPRRCNGNQQTIKIFIDQSNLVSFVSKQVTEKMLMLLTESDYHDFRFNHNTVSGSSQQDVESRHS